MFHSLKRILSAFLILVIITLQLSFTLPAPAFASTQLLSSKQLTKNVKSFLNTTPEAICKAYIDNSRGIDNSAWEALKEGSLSTYIIIQSVSSASAAGAGALSAYAGIASSVSQLGLGWLTTAIAGMMGSSVTGAAATAVVTSAVGDPVVMTTLIVGGTSVAAIGTYKFGEFIFESLKNLVKKDEPSKLTVEQLGNWAEKND